MRIKLILLTFTLFVFTLPAAAQDAACQPDLAQIINTLQQAQTAIDGGDTQSAITSITSARDTLTLEAAKCLNYAPETVGDKRTNPVPLGERKQFDLKDAGKASIQIANYLDNANEYAKNFEVGDGKRLIGIELSYWCESAADAICKIDAFSGLSVVGSQGVVYDTKKTNTLPNNEGIELYGGGQGNYSLAFLVDADDTEMVLVFSPGSGIDPVYFSLQ